MCEGVGISALDEEGNSVYLDLSRNANPDDVDDHVVADEAQEMLSSLLAYSTTNPSSTAHALLGRFGTLSAVLAGDEHELLSVPGVDPPVVRQIRRTHAALSFCLRERMREMPVVDNLMQLYEYLRIYIGWKQVEEAHLLILDRKNRLIHDHLIAKGSVCELQIAIREVVRAVIYWNGSALILVHNHPSGDPEPSHADVEFTRELAKTLATLDIAFHDHIVIGKDQYVSLRSRRHF